MQLALRIRMVDVEFCLMKVIDKAIHFYGTHSISSSAVTEACAMPEVLCCLIYGMIMIARTEETEIQPLAYCLWSACCFACSGKVTKVKGTGGVCISSRSEQNVPPFSRCVAHIESVRALPS